MLYDIIVKYTLIKFCPHGFVIRAEGLCGFQPTNEAGAESKLAYAMPCKEEEDKVKSAVILHGDYKSP